jgi:hypothetical protein
MHDHRRPMRQDAAAAEALDREALFARVREELLGACFSTAKELRHLAERCGFQFVPVEVVRAEERQVHMLLHPAGLGEVHVHAHRSQHWHPFYLRSVERGVPA